MACLRIAVLAVLLTCWAAPVAGATIVFHQGGDIYTMADDGTGAAPLVSGSGTQQSPAFRPDGAAIAYETDELSAWDVFEAPLGGGGPVALASDQGVVEGLPSYNGTGSLIAYQWWDGGPEYEIYVDDPADPAAGTRWEHSFDGADDSDPDVSWAADMIAWQADPVSGTDIYAAPVSGGAIAQLTTDGTATSAAWSPDGTRIAFVSARDGDEEIYVMDADGANEIRVSDDQPSSERSPAWSPDGSTIAFTSDRDGDHDVFTVPATGGGTPVELMPEDAVSQGGLDWHQSPAADPTVSIADAAATEGTPVVFTVSLSAPAATDATVDFAATAGSAGSDDFAAVSGTLTFTQGEQEKTIAVATTPDTADEADETFTVTLANPCCLVLGDAAATGTIADDDAPVAQPSPQPQPQPSPAPAPAPSPQPQENRTLVGRTSRGEVRVKLPGSDRYVDLAQVTELPNGTIVDTRAGRITLQAARGRAIDTAWFYDGVFRVRQRGGITDLTLRGAIGPCPRTGRASSAQRRKRRVRRLWGDGKGRFRTSGRFSSATVRGTWWLTEDSCAGTLTRVRSGSVTVRDRVRRRSVVVRRGKRYLARAGKA